MPMVNDEPKRVVSLIASATEIVCALGARDRLVGRSHECDFPEDVKVLPVLTSPKFPVNGSSYEIDQRVKAILQEGLSVYRVDAEKLKALRPPRHRDAGSLRGLRGQPQGRRAGSVRLVG
jgi:ABC-type Fe3+-hydroxamate transport system substrate-binding protein